jgi:transcriptional regulator with XRE-family HTH domain
MGALIRESRERAGMSQEALAEALGVSRQAVSKWEMGAAVPTPENLKALSEVLGVSFIEEPAPVEEKPAGRRWRIAALVLLGLCLLLLAGTVWLMVSGIHVQEGQVTVEVEAGRETEAAPSDIPGLAAEADVLTGVSFFDDQGKQLQLDLGDGWLNFTPGSRVWVAVTFREDAGVHGAALYLTPTGTETYALREQVALTSVSDGTVALLLWQVPEALPTSHMEVVLECDGGQTYSQMINVLAERGET